ncbi:MAG: Pr6Pr family membrane protein [Candidatus Microsaccharimonas sp.]
MNKRKQVLVGYKLLFALLGFAAIITEAATLFERGTLDIVNFLSFFTIQNNIFVVIALLLSAVVTASGKKSRALDLFRGFTTVFIIVVSVGFALLLAGLQGVALTAVPWDNTVLHYIIPIAVLVDFLIDRPTAKFSFKKNLSWLLYPAAYFLYTMVRGAITGWYPYPFLNPAKNSIADMSITIVALFVLGIVLIWLVGLLANRKLRKP